MNINQGNINPSDDIEQSSSASPSWRIFQGDVDPHDDIEQLLPPPPSWRKFGYALGKDKFEFVDIVSDSSLKIKTAQKGATFRVPPNQPELIDVINAALYLRRPLLVTGKPGTGKTSLAYAVAHELNLGAVLLWPITARSTLQEGLYRYDAISRLQDIKIETDSDPDGKNIQNKNAHQDIGRYIQLGPAGTALLPYKRPRVLLIDEVDKSDINLPNELLNLFEEGEYEIPELARLSEQVESVTVRTYDGGSARIKLGRVNCYQFPFIVLTSNGERDFPPAFLRRCLRLTIKDPDKTALTKIVEAHFLEEGVLEKAEPLITRFVEKRQKGDLAPDQLLNAVYLLARDLSFEQTDKDKLADLLLKYLTSAEDR